jgi:hypothetical protein
MEVEAIGNTIGIEGQVRKSIMEFIDRLKRQPFVNLNMMHYKISTIC